MSKGKGILKLIQCVNNCGKEIQAKTIKAQCLECSIEKKKLSRKQWKKNNSQKANTYKTIWRENNYDKINERNRKQYADNPEKSKRNVKKYHKNNPASHRYTISKSKSSKRNYASIADYMTREEFINWYSIQPQKCVICASTEKLCVDHCHKTGRPRGILCHKHNLIEGRIGTIKETEALLLYMKANDE